MGGDARVGILNTVLVAFLGCILATVLGVVAGVLRLSKNWIVNKLMAVYVEGFRNVPLLLCILVIFALMTEGMSQPRDFRVGGDASMILGESVAVTNRGVYVPGIILENGWFANNAINWLVILGVLIASILVMRAVSKRATRIQEQTGDRPVTWYQQLALLFVPTGIVLFLMGATMDFPSIGGFNFSGGIHLRNSLIALWLALSLYTGAFIAEIVRAGILAISKGQTEAAAALGIRPGRIMSLVILPQALRVIIPPMISNFLNLTKNSSLAIAVGYMDITGTLGGITLNQTGRAIEAILLLMAFYLAISLGISAIMNVYNNSIKLKER